MARSSESGPVVFFKITFPWARVAHRSIWKIFKEGLPDNDSHAIYRWKEGNVPESIILVTLYHRPIRNIYTFFLFKKHNFDHCRALAHRSLSGPVAFWIYGPGWPTAEKVSVYPWTWYRDRLQGKLIGPRIYACH